MNASHTPNDRRRSANLVDYLTPKTNSYAQPTLFCLLHGQSCYYICTYQNCRNRAICTACFASHPESHKRSISTYKEVFGPNIIRDIDEQIFLNSISEQNKEASMNFIDQLQLSFTEIRRRIEKTLETMYSKVTEKVLSHIFEPFFQTKDWEEFKDSIIESKNNVTSTNAEEQAKQLEDYLKMFTAANVALMDTDNLRGISKAQESREPEEPIHIEQEDIDETIASLRNILNKLYGRISSKISPLNTPAENIECTKVHIKPYKSSTMAFQFSPFYTRPMQTLNNSFKASSNTSLGFTKDKIAERSFSSKGWTENLVQRNFENEDILANKQTPFIYDEYLETEVMNHPYVGPIKLDIESVYKGQMKDGQPFGKGKQVWKDGKKFEGYYREGSIQGKGRMIHPDQDTYEGQWERGLANGVGKYRRIDGWVYEGEWLDDQPHGMGVETWPDSTKYEGGYKKGLKDGKGTLKCADGSFYRGEFKDNMFDGDGLFVWPEGRKYEGKWVKNLKEGKGTVIWPDGRKYVGEFLADKRYGFGVFEWADGKKYVGSWKDGKPHGQGRLQSPNGEIMEGDWKDGKLGHYALISVRDLKTVRDAPNKSMDLSDFSRQSISKLTLKGFESPGGGINNYSVTKSVIDGTGDRRKEAKSKTRPDLRIVIKRTEADF